MEFDSDILIIGGGAAGTFAAWGAARPGVRVTVIDVGNDYAGVGIDAPSLAALRRNPQARDALLGPSFESLDRIFLRRGITPKLAGPLMRFVTRDPADWDQDPEVFRAITSHAKGGLANVWGAQVYRFGTRALQDYPIGVHDLAGFYDRVSREIGISGSATDDLAEIHGPEPMLQPPVVSSPLAERLIERYTAKRHVFARQRLRLGKPRLAVLTEPYAGRPALKYDNLEFVAPRNEAFYSPHLTLDRLIREDRIRYLPRHEVIRYEDDADSVIVTARAVDGGAVKQLRARKLILCLGCLQTARLVLHRHEDTTSRLPLLETPMTFTPLVDVSAIGLAHPEHSYSSDLSLAVEDERYPTTLVGMIYNLDGVMRSSLLFDLPVPATAAMQVMRIFTPAMLAMQVYYPQAASDQNRLWLQPDGKLGFSYRFAHDFAVEKRLLAAFRRIGFLSAAALSKLAPPGDSIHYGGALPMRAAPTQRYETHRSGRLYGTRHVYVGDSAAFPFLPAKNLTFTIMANAVRIGEHVAADLTQPVPA